jgi:hypothetical protein
MRENDVKIYRIKGILNFSNVLMIFVCKLPINKIKGYLCSILSLSGQSTSGSPDHGPDKDSIENKMNPNNLEID